MKPKKKTIQKLGAFALTAGMAASMAGTALAADTPFSDVPTLAWYKPFVDYTYSENLFAGTSAATFSPLREITRAELVTAMGNMQKQLTGEDPRDEKMEPQFTDVASGQYYTYYIGWAQENGVVAGYPGGTFHPDELITREMLAVILNNYVKSSGAVLEGQREINYDYIDETGISDWAADAVANMTDHGILSGSTDHSFSPARSTTRAEASTVITRIYQELRYPTETNVNYQYIRYDADTSEQPFDLLGGFGSCQVISNYEDYTALVDAAQAQAYPHEGDTFTPVEESYFENGNILAVELQHTGGPQYHTKLSRYNVAYTVDPSTAYADLTFFGRDAGGAISDTVGYVFFIEVPKDITDAAVDEVHRVDGITF